MTLSYETCKKLKDAGFPQEGMNCEVFQSYRGDICEKVVDNWDIKCCDDMDCHVIQNSDTYIPLLSELIEACGEGFESLERADLMELGISWRAYMSDNAYEKYSVDYPCVKECCGYDSGDTPEEAVAALYLALHPIEDSI